MPTAIKLTNLATQTTIRQMMSRPFCNREGNERPHKVKRPSKRKSMQSPRAVSKAICSTNLIFTGCPPSTTARTQRTIVMTARMNSVNLTKIRSRSSKTSSSSKILRTNGLNSKPLNTRTGLVALSLNIQSRTATFSTTA